MTDPVRPPAQPVDHFAPPRESEGSAARAVALVPVAAAVFGVIAWLATAVLAYESERKGVAGATVAVFPTVFGLVAWQVRRNLLRAGRPAVAAPLVAGATAGGLGMALFWLFMQAVWPLL